MKIKELILALEKFDPEMQVVVGGFDEQGYADIERVERIQAVRRKSQMLSQTFGDYEAVSANNNSEILEMIIIDHL